MRTMKRLAVVFALAAMALLFTGCEVWLFLADGGGGGASGIDVYADMRTNGITDVTSGQYVSAALLRDQGSYVVVQTKKAAEGAETINTSFTGVETDDYIVVVWLDGDGDGTFVDGDVGFTSSSFYYVSGGYKQFVLDSSGDWDDGNVEDPRP